MAASGNRLNNQPHRLAICGPLAVEVPDNLFRDYFYETIHIEADCVRYI